MEAKEMEKIKVLFQKDGAENARTGEVAEVVFQHFSKPFSFRDPNNAKILEALNCYRIKKFGELKPATEGDIRAFAGKEVFELVVDTEGNSFERAHYKAFMYEKWNPRNMDPLEPKRKWKRLSEDQTSVMKDVTKAVKKVLGATLSERCPVDLDIVVSKVVGT
jgi:hypothetical protein